MTAPRCRLFLLVPDTAEPQGAAACLAAAFQAGDIDAVLITPRHNDEGTAEIMHALKPLARHRGVPAMIAANPELARRLGADGVEVADLAAYVAARKLLGAGAFIGADAGTSRHAAMELGEAGADYIGFHNDAAGGHDLIAWWAELFEVPCVALDPVEPAGAGELARLGVDFVRPDTAMWASPDAARRVIADTLAAVAGASA